MDKAEVERVQRLLDEDVRGRFPEGTIEQVALLQYGDDPAVEPGKYVVRVIVAGNREKPELERVAHQLDASLRQQLEQLPHDLREKMPAGSRIEIRVGRDQGGQRFFMASAARSSEAPALAGTDLTPVMARLGPADLETLDTLITAGIASNRAEAVRWTLARIRERPAYGQLRAKAAEIEELKAQF